MKKNDSNSLLAVEKQNQILEKISQGIQLIQEPKDRELDLCERKAIEEALKESEERYRSLVDLSPDAILVQIDGKIAYTNKSGMKIIGIDLNDLIGEPIFKFIHPDYRPIIAERLKLLYKGEVENVAPVEIKLLKPNGDIIDIEVNSRLIKYEGKIGVQTIGRDITERKKAEAKIKFIAYHDHLTKLPNRLYFQQLLHEQFDLAKQTNEKMAILFLDIDNFKEVNDSLGHTLADQLLKQVGNRVKFSLPSAAIMARVSGDEFSILLPNIKDVIEVEDIAKNILAACNDHFSLENCWGKVTLSIGISLYPACGQDPEELIKNADLAMNIAKKKGKNTYQVFTNEIKETFERRRKLSEDLKYALSEKQFVIYYQPIINVEKNTINSVEALLRWNHPEEGLISPGEFIPLIEENGLIIPIGEWVLKNACSQVKQWHQEGLSELALKVNLSVRQFEQENFVEMIASILTDLQFQPESLELEITESLLMRNTEYTSEILNKLKALHVKISLDDFGKGFSSLSYLTEFPFDVLKIDRSFTQKMLIDNKSAAVVKTVINLAHQLNLTVVAEGVETEEQFKFLVENQCEEVQGFLFNKPLPVEEFELIYLKRQLT